MQELAQHAAYRLLESGPVVMVSTRHHDHNNVMTMGFHMMLQHRPAQIACVIGPWDHSYAAMVETGECVIAIPTVDLAEKVVDIGNCSGQDVDKFSRFSLTALPASLVSAPLIGECLANLECEVVDTSCLESYNLFVLQVRKIWFDATREEQRTLHHCGDGEFIVGEKRIDLGERMVLWQHLSNK